MSHFSFSVYQYGADFPLNRWWLGKRRRRRIINLFILGADKSTSAEDGCGTDRTPALTLALADHPPRPAPTLTHCTHSGECAAHVQECGCECAALSSALWYKPGQISH